MGAQYILCHSNTMMKNNIYQPNDIANHIGHDDMCFSSPKPRVPAASQSALPHHGGKAFLYDETLVARLFEITRTYSFRSASTV